MTGILTFDTTHHALWAEEIATRLLLGIEIIPAPADSGARCDLAIEVLLEDEATLIDALEGESVPFRRYVRSGSAP
jgi:hypothetical protein